MASVKAGVGGFQRDDLVLEHEPAREQVDRRAVDARGVDARLVRHAEFFAQVGEQLRFIDLAAVEHGVDPRGTRFLEVGDAGGFGLVGHAGGEQRADEGLAQGRRHGER